VNTGCSTAYLPWCVQPAANVMAVPAKILPCIVHLAAKVAAVPALQKIFFGLAPPARMTFLSAAVEKVVGMRKMKTALGSEPASSVRSPAITERDKRHVRGSDTL